MVNRNNERGDIADFIVVIVCAALAIGFFWGIACLRLEPSEQIVSGIVYNTTNDGAFSGNTNFSVRADVNTYVSKGNESSYCVPGNSPYKALINKAAANKSIKVVVTTKKYFGFVANPFICVNNVTVTEEK